VGTLVIGQIAGLRACVVASFEIALVGLFSRVGTLVCGQIVGSLARVVASFEIALEWLVIFAHFFYTQI